MSDAPKTVARQSLSEAKRSYSSTVVALEGTGFNLYPLHKALVDDCGSPEAFVTYAIAEASLKANGGMRAPVVLHNAGLLVYCALKEEETPENAYALARDAILKAGSQPAEKELLDFLSYLTGTPEEIRANLAVSAERKAEITQRASDARNEKLRTEAVAQMLSAQYAGDVLRTFNAGNGETATLRLIEQTLGITITPKS